MFNMKLIAVYYVTIESKAEIRAIQDSSRINEKEIEKTGENMIVLITVNHTPCFSKWKVEVEEFYKKFLASA